MILVTFQMCLGIHNMHTKGRSLLYKVLEMKWDCTGWKHQILVILFEYFFIKPTYMAITNKPSYSCYIRVPDNIPLRRTPA